MATQALSTLLPKSFTIPAKLTSTAETLLSLSRQRLPNLKPDEEIARAHACAEIACRRLRVALRLPNIKSGAGAPCRPAVYKKLLQFLEERLADVDVLGTPKRNPTATPSTKQSTGRKRNVQEISVEEVETPTKKRRTGGVTPKSASVGFAGRIEAARKDNGSQREAALPHVRRLCTALKTPKMVPHVYTGLCVISSIAEAEGHVVQSQSELHLLAAVYLLTLTRMQKGDMTNDLYDVASSAAIRILGLDDGGSDAQTEIEKWIGLVNDSEWTNEGKGADWWETVPQEVLAPLKVAAVEAAATVGDIVDEDGEDEATPRASRQQRDRAQDQIDRQEELRRSLQEEDPDDVLLPGLGTMMHDGIDYYNKERLAENQLWIQGILKQIAVAESAKPVTKSRKVRAAA